MTKTYSQSTNAATAAKWRRMCANRGWHGVKYLECGFSSWFLQKGEDGNLQIVAQTDYHAESTLDEMYERNFSTWK